MPATAMAGASRGMLALAAGFFLEAAVAWWFVRRGSTQSQTTPSST
jgi:hypothetical protein